MSSTNEAECCPPQSASDPSKPNHPHPVSGNTGYKYKGSFEKLGGFDEVYVVGKDKKHAVLVVYDIFGYWDTTLKGLDTLASELESSTPATIFVPDFFRGNPFPMSKDGDKAELGKFFSGTAKIADRQPEVVEFAKGLKKDGYEKVSLLGYCWGGKVVLISLASDETFTSGAIVHPAMIAAEDGENLRIPLGFYPSKDEPKDVIDQIKALADGKPFADKNDYHYYSSVHHGWAAARANLDNEDNLKQFNDVYKRLGDFFTKAHA